MKVSVFILLLIFYGPINVSGQSSRQFTINGSIKEGLQNGKAFLRYWGENGPYLDSAVLSNGQFSISGNVPGKLTIASIYLLSENEREPTHENTCEVWLEAGIINLITEKRLQNARFSGSEIQKQFSKLQQSLIQVKQKSFQLDDAYEEAEEKKDALRKDKLLNEEYPALFVEKQKLLGMFIKEYPASLISAFKFEEFAGEGQINLAVVEPVYNSLHDSIKQHPQIKKVAKLMEITRQTAPGMQAIEFSQTDTSGRSLSLSAFKGKYVLIDFWAGWCVPCRAENPHLIKLYNQYNSKGFDILGVSLDGERKRWTNAIITDKLVWSQVSDLKIFDNAVAKLYGITSIPQNILIGPDAKIIAWNLRSTVLDKKLEKIFK